MQKAELRKIYLQKRKTLSNDEVFLLSDKIFEKFIHYFKPKKGDKVHIFLPIKKFNEIETRPFIDYCFKHEIRVFVPKVVDEDLISIEIDIHTEYVKSQWGIEEPLTNQDAGEIDFDFIITPLLYCDVRGNRVGYGKGFYDRLFSMVSSKTKKIGVNYFNPDVIIDDVWEKDIPLDYLLTPTDKLSFLKGG